MRRPLVVLLTALAVLPIAVYASSLAFPLIAYDDPVYVSDSPIVSSPAAGGLAIAWTRPYFHDYIPITHTTLWLDGRSGRMHPLPFRLQSLAWHLLAALLLAFVARRWTASPERAAAVALLFAVHPLSVESVAWVSSRKNVVSLALLLAAYLVWRRGEERDRRVPGRIGAGVLFICSVLSKAAAAGFPLIVFGDSWILRKKKLRSALADVTPYALVAAVAVVFVLRLRHDLPAERLAGPLGLVAVDLQVLARYILNTIAPVRLSAFYFVDLDGFGSIAPWLSLGVLAAFIALPFAWIRDRRTATFQLLWAIAGLLTALNITRQPHPSADRFFYWSLPGLLAFLITAAADGLSEIQARFGGDRVEARARTPRLATALLVVAVAACGLLAMQRTAVWRSSRALFEDAVRKSPRSSVARMHLANTLSNEPSAESRRRAANQFRSMFEAPDAGRRLKPVVRDGATFFISIMDHGDGHTEEADARIYGHFEGRESFMNAAILLARYELITGRPERVVRRLQPPLAGQGLLERGRRIAFGEVAPWSRDITAVPGVRDLYIALHEQRQLTAALGLLGSALLETGRPIEAASALALLCAVTGPDPALLSDLADAYEGSGDERRAAAARRRAGGESPPVNDPGETGGTGGPG